MLNSQITFDSDGTSRLEYAPVPSGGRVAKHVKFGWSNPGQKPKFEWVDKLKIKIDHENYQRLYSHGRSVAMARKFDWQRFEAITLSRRPDGSLWVVEGQHRLMAAMLRADVQQVPCLVYDSIGVADEAKAFVEIGTGSRHLTSFDKFQPSITMGLPSAVLVQGLLDKAGYRASDTASVRAVKCVGLLQKLATVDAGAFEAAWPLVVDVHHGEALHNRIVDALFYLYRASNGRINQDPYRKRLIQRGRANLIADANTAAQFYEHGGAKVWASGIAKVMNKGLQVGRRIEVFGASLGEEA